MKQQFVVGSRGSELALTQTKWLIGELQKKQPSVAFEIRVIKTAGDKMLAAPFTQMVGKGFFTKELEEALVKKEIDFAVHSLKDVPTDSLEGLKIVAYPKREDPRDVLVSESGQGLKDLPQGAKVGTSSPRRQAWLAALRSDLEVVPLRGNLNTRLNKVFGRELKDSNDKVDAAVLAFAGLKRLGLEDQVTEVLSIEDFLPAPGQGILGIQCRAQDQETIDLLETVNHAETVFQADAERAFLAAWGGGCSVPLGAYAQIEGDTVCLEAAIYLEDKKNVIRDVLKGKTQEGVQVGQTLAKRLKEL